MANKILNKFIRKVNKKFEKYFVAYGMKEEREISLINIIIEDRDVSKMKKEDLRKKLNEILGTLIKEDKKKIKPNTILLSDLNESNIWEILGKYAVINDVKALNSFVNLKLPNDFMKAYENIPKKFKLVDFGREINKISKKKYHRNTYQNWLKSLKTAGFIELHNKTYHKIEGPYKKNLWENLKKI